MYIYFRLLHQVYVATVKKKRKLIGDKASYKDLANVELPRSLRKHMRMSTVARKCEKKKYIYINVISSASQK